MSSEGLEDRRLLAFALAAEYATAAGPHELTVAKINADSQPDYVAIENGLVTIRLGNADGSFGAPVSTGGDIHADSATLADFNNDGTADLVTVLNNQLSVQIGNGNGTFQAARSNSLPYQQEVDVWLGPVPSDQRVRSFATGDLNNDGTLDLVVAGSAVFRSSVYFGPYGYSFTYSSDDYVNVLLGNGSGDFGFVDADPLDVDLDAFRVGTDQVATSVTVADLNNDGQQDVLTSKYYGGLSALLGDGTGKLQSAIHSPYGIALPSLSVGDVDGDGIIDALSRSGDSLLVQKGLGDGRFVQESVVNTNLRLDSAVIGDVNGDGQLDLIAAGLSPCQNVDSYYGTCLDETHTRLVSVLLGNGHGDFSLPVVSPLGTTPGQEYNLLELTLTNLNADTLPDLILVDRRYAGGTLTAFNDGLWVRPMELSINDVSVVEGNSGTRNAVFTVTLSDDPGQPVTVDFATASDWYDDSRAVAGEDYGPQSGTLTFGPGILTRTITVPINGDRVSEGDGTFYVNLTNPVGAALRDSQGVGTIVDDEPVVSINHPYGSDPLTVVEGDVGTTSATFTVSLAAPYDQVVTVDYYTLTGHTNDIIAASGTLRFLPGETSKPLTVQIVNDRVHEDLEAFDVYLSNPSANARIGNEAAYCYIQDNDPLPTVSINDVSKNEGNSGKAKFTFTLTLSAPSAAATYVEFTAANGTANSQDYTATPGTVYFSTGATTATITVYVNGDRTKEANETFFVNLISATGATIADSQGVGTILNDDGSPPPPPKVRITSASVVEGNAGTKRMAFTVTLSTASQETVWVSYATHDGQATVADNDYQAIQGRLQFRPGERTKILYVTIPGDRKKEADETFSLDLFDATGAAVDIARGVGRILNNDRL
ncbi:MAG: VCBS repeat-containing protein [Planctomycetes bacterium]|nr:VCBS repeat-containing protein [Planctomycetota bacterium]